MNTHTLDSALTAALRDLDPAPETALTDAEHERADATFARIVATPTHDPAPEPSRPRRRRTRLLASVGLVGAAGVAVPALMLGGGSAFASWTPTPEPLTSAEAAEAATTCRMSFGVPDQGERAVTAERRGEWTYVLIAGPESSGACLMPNDLVGEPADLQTQGGFGMYSSDPWEAPRVARDGLVETGVMGGSVSTDGRWGLTTDEEWFEWTLGYVGSDVTGVTVHPPVGPDVEASLDNGQFAAWWPLPKPSSENLEAMGGWTYTVTLSDGTTREITD